MCVRDRVIHFVDAGGWDPEFAGGEGLGEEVVFVHAGVESVAKEEDAIIAEFDMFPDIAPPPSPFPRRFGITLTLSIPTR